jgi:BirA family biotin operon repressor/biotin-[acetyl-CoA-carboxylase] ligase
MPNAEYVILKELLAREPGWVSGSALAAKLGVSRVAVWQHMSRLRAAGFVFEARRSLGYRLGARPPTLHPTLIESLLKVRPRGFSLLVLDEVDSTNDEAARQFAARRPAPFAILARRQTRGRGRFGRVWHSASPTNLYASFAFRPRVTPRQMQTFTLWMGVNVCELLANFTGASPGIKWPNDLVHQGRKVGGMLTEARIDADQIRDLVFGVGLNVNTPAAAWPADLARRAVSLAEIAGTAARSQPPRRRPDRPRPARLPHLRRGPPHRQLRRPLESLRCPPRPARHPARGRPPPPRHRHRGRRRGLARAADARGRLQRFHAGEVTLEKGPDRPVPV